MIPLLRGSSNEAHSIQHSQSARRHPGSWGGLRCFEGIKRPLGERALHTDACALLISILLAVHRTESRRAFWLGFALFGWCYLALSLVPSIESRFLTTKALAYLDSKVPGRSLGVYTIQLTGTGSGAPKVQDQNLPLGSTACAGDSAGSSVAGAAQPRTS